MQLKQHENLWQRIRDFAIDDPGAFVKYSDKLARYNSWSKEYTSRVIEEYKKFLFLCCVLPRGASPSKPIDEAWHLHLTYTHNYWKELCGNVLEKEIHHFPSKGGSDENVKHAEWYNATLDAYREIFEMDAPADIWLAITQLPLAKKIDEQAASGYLKEYKKHLYLFAFPFLIILILYGRIFPYNLTGPQFLVFYSCLFAATVTYFLLIRLTKKNEILDLVSQKYKGDANLYQLARFVYGRERSLRAAVVDLVEREVLKPERKSTFTFNSSNYKYSSSEDNPLVIHLLRNAKDGDKIHYLSLSGYYDDAATYHEGLASLYRSMPVRDWRPLIISIIIGTIGIARIIQGSINNRPVEYLIMLMIFYVFMMIYTLSSLSGKNILQQYFGNSFKQAYDGGHFQVPALASAFVFLGLESISGMNDYSRLHRTFSKHPLGSAGITSGCGSSGCGSSGCSSGCGGGCGGCGGGD